MSIACHRILTSPFLALVSPLSFGSFLLILSAVFLVPLEASV